MTATDGVTVLYVNIDRVNLVHLDDADTCSQWNNIPFYGRHLRITRHAVERCLSVFCCESMSYTEETRLSQINAAQLSICISRYSIGIAYRGKNP